MIFIFFITEAMICLIGGCALIAFVLLGTMAAEVCTFCAENFWIFISATIILKIVLSIYYAKIKNWLFSISFLVATSQITALFLDTLYQIFLEGVNFFGNGWLTVFIVTPILIGYSGINLRIIYYAIKNEEVNVFWIVGVVGWLLNIFAFS